MYLSKVNREFLRSLMGEKSALVNRITPHHMGEFLVFSCVSKQDADEISGVIKKDYENLEAMIGNYPIKVVIKEKKVATKYKIVYTIPSRKAEKINMTTTVATTEYTLENFVEPLREAINGATNEEIFNAPLSPDTLGAIAGDIIANRMKGGVVAPTSTPVVQEEPKSEEESDTSKTPSQILKDLGLPYQLGKVKKLKSSVRVPAKLTDKTKATEIKGIKSFLQEVLAALTPKEDKRVYVLRNISEETVAGKIYLDSLIPCFKEVDTKDEYKESRRTKLIEAAQSLLGENIAEAA
jgi:hypothetical protein